MLSKRYESPKSTVELGYMCPRGLLDPPAVTLTKYLKLKKNLLRCIHHFKSDLMNDMDHMRISGTEVYVYTTTRSYINYTCITQ